MVTDIGVKIKEYRERAGISQRKLGLMVGVSDKAISSYESGRTVPPLQTLQLIAQELDIPLTSLILDPSDETDIKEVLLKIELLLKQVSSELETIKTVLKENNLLKDEEIDTPPEIPVPLNPEEDGNSPQDL